MSTTTPSQPLLKFWETRLGRNFNERGTGHRRFTREYNAHLFDVKRKALDRLLERNNISLKGARCHDAACGTGFFEEYAQKNQAAFVEGTDITSVSAEKLSKIYPQYRFHQRDITQLPLPGTENSYDGVAALDVLYLLKEEADFERAMRGLAESLKPGGWLLISDRFFRTWHYASHIHFRTWGRYESVAKPLGLEMVDIIPFYSLMGRSFIPFLGPWVLSPFGSLMGRIDDRLQTAGSWVSRWVANENLALLRKKTSR